MPSTSVAYSSVDIHTFDNTPEIFVDLVIHTNYGSRESYIEAITSFLSDHRDNQMLVQYFKGAEKIGSVRLFENQLSGYTLPVVTDDIVKNNINGIIVKKNNKQALSDAMIKICKDKKWGLNILFFLWYNKQKETQRRTS